MLAAVLATFCFGLVLLAADFVNTRTPVESGLARNPYGGGEKIKELDVAAGQGKREKISVKVSEQAYSGDELKSMFKRCTVQLDKVVLGKNESFDHIEEDMELAGSVPGFPVEISWEHDRYDVMNVCGEINQDELAPEGTLITLKAVLTYTQNPKEQMLYEQAAVVFPKTLDKKEEQLQNIERAVAEADRETQTEKELILPREAGGRSILFFSSMESRGAVLMAMSALIGILLIALEKQNQEKEVSKRKEQMRQDYPGIIMKLTLLLGAGMTVKRAWKKITADYETEKEDWGVRYAYEEMGQACNEMSSGITEAESYERFGRRCGLQEYIKLGAMLSQNIRRGTKGVREILQMEAVQSFEERKARAKRLGEEAGTKLLAPMFLMLAVVLVIVIVPAFMSVQM